MTLDFKLLDETSNKAVLLIHGLTGSPFEMKKYAKALHKAGYNVFCDCLPGHGDSKISIRTVRWDDWYNDCSAKYKELTEKYDKVYISGLCLGAVLALALAEEHQDSDGIVALSTTLFLDGWTIPWYNFLMPLGLYTILRYYYSFPERHPYGLKNEGIRKRISLLQRKNTVALDHYPLSCIYELLKGSKLTIKKLQDVQSPVLIMHAVEDDLTSLKSSDIVFERISSSDKEYIKLQNCYHHVVMDNERELVFENAIRFFDRLSNETKEAECLRIS